MIQSPLIKKLYSKSHLYSISNWVILINVLLVFTLQSVSSISGGSNSSTSTSSTDETTLKGESSTIATVVSSTNTITFTSISTNKTSEITSPSTPTETPTQEVISTTLEIINCIWGSYGEWTTCTKSCGGGEKTRSRSEETPASNGGLECEGNSTERSSCNEDSCPDISTTSLSTSVSTTSVSTTQQSTEHLSTEATTSANDDSEEGTNESWIILVAALPIIGGLIFLVALGVWYNRRKKAKSNAENWKYSDKKNARFSEVEITPIIKNGNSKAAKRGTQGVPENKDFSIQLDLGDNVEFAPGGFYG